MRRHKAALESREGRMLGWPREILCIPPLSERKAFAVYHARETTVAQSSWERTRNRVIKTTIRSKGLCESAAASQQCQVRCPEMVLQVMRKFHSWNGWGGDQVAKSREVARI